MWVAPINENRIYSKYLLPEIVFYIEAYTTDLITFSMCKYLTNAILFLEDT